MHGGEGHAAGGTATVERDFDITQLTRVEGEGRLRLRLREGRVVEARLNIFEAPRYFEQLVVGRLPDDVLDIVARICGICPVAYQMSAVHAFESAFGVEIDPVVRSLRRLLYCGEWIESHALHVTLLHAPDYLGVESGIALAAIDRPAVERGLALKKTGNQIVALLGGRPIHPVSVKVGGFSRAPRVVELETLKVALDAAVKQSLEIVDWVAGFETPACHEPARLVALRHASDYPMNEGRIVSTDKRIDIANTDWSTTFEERQVEGTNALQSHTRDGQPYQVGPSARITLARDQLHPLAGAALEKTGLADEIRVNPFRSIVARAIELVHAAAEARDIVAGYRPPDAASVPFDPRAGSASWATEAPRGLLFHDYRLDERGRVSWARIVPPTSQNQAAIEAALIGYAPRVLDLPDDEARVRIEQLVRAYDPCISCATHFLDVTVEREP
ncbi:MAG: Ni/Fe hydrogenase subunit alpha [Candidatus Limnocylindrales bacterium]